MRPRHAPADDAGRWGICLRLFWVAITLLMGIIADSMPEIPPNFRDVCVECIGHLAVVSKKTESFRKKSPHRDTA